MKNAPISETGMSMRGRNAMTQSRKKKKIICNDEENGNENGLLHFSDRSSDDARVIYRDIDLVVGRNVFFDLSKAFVDLIGDLDVVCCPVGDDPHANHGVPDSFEDCLLIFRTEMANPTSRRRTVFRPSALMIQIVEFLCGF